MQLNRPKSVPRTLKLERD